MAGGRAGLGRRPRRRTNEGCTNKKLNFGFVSVLHFGAFRISYCNKNKEATTKVLGMFEQMLILGSIFELTFISKVVPQVFPNRMQSMFGIISGQDGSNERFCESLCWFLIDFN